MRARLLLVIAALMCLPSHGETIEPEVQLALQLFEAMELEEANRQMVDHMIQSQIQQEPSLAPYRHVLRKFFDEYLAYDSLKYEYATFYLEAYTTDEIEDLIAFYSTPTGKKSIWVDQQLFFKVSQFSAELVETHLIDLQRMLEEETARILELQESQGEG